MIPRVSFLMPVASPAPFLRSTLESIATQTRDEWRLTVVVDGPGDDVHDALSSMEWPASRLTRIQLPVRSGISEALNAGLQRAETTLVARIDADDVCAPQRLEEQLRVWDSSMAVLGSEANTIDEEGRSIGSIYLRPGSDVRAHMLWRNQIVHSSALFDRKLALSVGGYDPACHLREDYHLWLRMGVLGRIAVSPDALLSYRLSGGQISRGRASRQAVALISDARRDLAQHIGYRGWRAPDAAWRLAQTPFYRRHLGRLSRAQRPTHDGTGARSGLRL